MAEWNNMKIERAVGGSCIMSHVHCYSYMINKIITNVEGVQGVAMYTIGETAPYVHTIVISDSRVTVSLTRGVD